ncbi:hypothetical protein [Nocardiopsis valliformis]|uniref:hypothetical protein n=1 Tax=Nocardiopsis valliformis TaxID=239974 RepID=UPI00034C6E3E|nr:hypothetical protein [Nocardiopsis valliformis]
MTSNRELQNAAAQVLTDLLDAPDLPEASWRLHRIRKFTQIFTTPRLDCELLDGQTDSHQAVRDWAAHLGTDVEELYGYTLAARAVVKGIVVKVWCAIEDPEFSDDIPATQGAAAAGRV